MGKEIFDPGLLVSVSIVCGAKDNTLFKAPRKAQFTMHARSMVHRTVNDERHPVRITTQQRQAILLQLHEEYPSAVVATQNSLGCCASMPLSSADDPRLYPAFLDSQP